MRNFILLIAIVILGSTSSFAQFGSVADANTMAYDPVEIVQDFEDRINNPTQENEFVQDFFTQYSVPLIPASGETLSQTWTTWVTGHPAAIEQYLIARKQNHDQYFLQD